MTQSFMRYERKYLVTREQAAAFRDVLLGRMQPDFFGEYLVQNLYYDTVGWDVIRACVEKPLYKEKLRLRCYGTQQRDSELYLELKKKYRQVVSKRRVTLPAHALAGGHARSAVTAQPSQVAREIAYYLAANAVSEQIYISFQRSAFIGREDLRVTFDTDVRFRLDRLDFTCPDEGRAILPPGKTLLEIKTPSAMPLWLARHLSENKIFPTPFSKFGVCYTEHIICQPGTEGKTLAYA